MNEYLIRKATLNDVPFLIEAVTEALKSNSEKLNFSTLFNLTEQRVKPIIGSMFEEEIDECEFSISSFLLIEYHGKPIAAVGGWIEGLIQKTPSSILKSNLINFCFPRESLEFVIGTSSIISDILIERENLTLQIEYVYVERDHRGKNIAHDLIQQHITNALLVYPELKKVQVQLYSNNTPAINAYRKSGFQIVKTFRSENVKIFEFLPHNETLLMEIDLTKILTQQTTKLNN
jgi:ribosomal protein S18 acetylase RimI-like enzyme